MNGRDLTKLVLLAVIVFLVVYDVIILRMCGRDATISIVIHDCCRDHPLIAMAIGVVAGHCFFPLVSYRR